MSDQVTRGQSFAHLKITDLAPGPRSPTPQEGNSADEAEPRTGLKLLKILHLQISRSGRKAHHSFIHGADFE